MWWAAEVEYMEGLLEKGKDGKCYPACRTHTHVGRDNA